MRVGLRPALEPGIGADIVDPHRLALAQQHAEHAMLPRQRADRLALAFRYAVDDELGERPVVVGHAERRVPGTDEGAGRPDDHLQHVAGRQLPGHGEHHLAHPLQHVVLAAGRRPAGPAVPGVVTTAPQPRIAHTSHATGVLGRPDLLINNAGTLGASPLPAIADYPVEELRAAFEVNVLAPIALTQLLLPALRRRGGAVLNITSDAAVEAYAGWGGYGAAKAALEQASNVLAAEEHAVPLSCVDPRHLPTPLHPHASPLAPTSPPPPPATP